MKIRRFHNSHGFTLVEVALSLAVVSISLLSIFGVLTSVLGMIRDTSMQMTGTEILTAVVADVRSTPPASTKSTRYQISLPTNGTATQTIYLDEDGNILPTATGAIFAATITVTPPPTNQKSVNSAQVIVFWPILASATTMRHVELTTLMNRN